nr:FAD-dependent oxidoreductase [Komagataeibacter sp. FXV3]
MTLKVAVIGAGAAGLGAAWTLVKAGHDVTVFEKEADVGGRCRTFYWRHEWLIRGAAAFIKSEQNLIDVAKELGIYRSDLIIDAQKQHKWNVFRHNQPVVELDDFRPADILMCQAMPLKEKIALSTMFPMLLTQLARNDPRDPTSAARLDTETACEYFSKKSPFFVNYILEPIMQTFCGYGKDDYSLAWLAWLMAGPYAWATGWWQCAERGVGGLTHNLGLAIDREPTGSVQTGVCVTAVSEKGNQVELTRVMNGNAMSEVYDAVVVAVPGNMVPRIVTTLNDDERRFFDGVQYVPHHICYVSITFPFEEEVNLRRVLPTVEGFRIVSNFTIRPFGNDTGEHLLYLEMKGDGCEYLSGKSDQEIINHCLNEIRQVEPRLHTAEVIDTYVQHNDSALCRRYVGYTELLKQYRDNAPSGRRIVYAGDYLISSSVGQAHYSGLVAAEHVLRNIGQ